MFNGETKWLNGVPALLPDYLRRQRWFAGKARSIEGIELVDGALLPETTATSVLALFDVRYAEGRPERYSLVVAEAAESGTLPVLGKTAEGKLLAEGTADASAVGSLLRQVEKEGTLPTIRGRAIRFGDAHLDAESSFRGRLPAAKPLGVEQSNTSLLIDRRYVLKIFRKIEAGESPELEVGRFLLERTSFRDVPTLRGSVSYLGPAGTSSTLGVLQDWIPNEGDAWKYVLSRLERAAGDERTMCGLADEMRELGRSTGELHTALASDPQTVGFAPELVEQKDVESWAETFLERAQRVTGLLARQKEPRSEPSGARSVGLFDGRRLLQVRPPSRWQATEDRFERIRIHGDFHLGQVLCSEGRFVLFDFEGEPARSIPERRRKTCALKDVAGMLRSFDYAGETFVRATSSRSSGETTGRSASLSRPLREGFLEGYLGATWQRGVGFLPRGRDAVEAWVDFFELDKAVYELEYEINNRPDWVGIPLAGIRSILARRAPDYGR